MMVEWNETGTAYNDAATLHDCSSASATDARSGRDGLGEQQSTYAELNRAREPVGPLLRSLGVNAEARVGVMLERTPLLLTGFCGAQSGGRLCAAGSTLSAAASCLHAHGRGSASASDQRPDLAPVERGADICLDREGILAKTRTRRLVHPQNLAYVIYTSGSTGNPKGVQIPHQAVVNFLSFMQQQLRVTEQDVLLSVTSLSFDIAVLELFMPLITGARRVAYTRTDDGCPSSSLNNSCKPARLSCRPRRRPGAC